MLLLQHKRAWCWPGHFISLARHSLAVWWGLAQLRVFDSVLLGLVLPSVSNVTNYFCLWICDPWVVGSWLRPAVLSAPPLCLGVCQQGFNSCLFPSSLGRTLPSTALVSEMSSSWVFGSEWWSSSNPLLKGSGGGLWWLKWWIWGLAALYRIRVLARSPPEAASSQMGVPSSSGELLHRARDLPGSQRCWLGFCRARLS